MSEAKTPAKSRVPRDEAVRLGKEIYDKVVLPKVERDHHGEYVAIDVDSRTWAVAPSTRDAIEGLREQCPDAINILCERVGYRALRSYSGRSLRRTE